MKIKYLLPLLLVLLLPVAGMSTNEKDLEKFCDDIPHNEVSQVSNKSDILKFILGESNNRGIYKENIVDYCNGRYVDCTKAFSGITLPDGRITNQVNIIAYVLFLNNIEAIELLISKKPELKKLIDTGLYPENEDWANGEFLTPALNAIKEGQLGVLKYLVTKYNVNLFKNGGYVYYRKTKPQVPLSAQEWAENRIERWTNKRPNADRLKCAEAVEKYLDKWFADHRNDQAMLRDAEVYNDELLEVVPNYRVENITPFEFTPAAPLDLFKLQGIEENFAQNIDAKIDALIEKIMRGFDLSDFGNQA